MVKGKGKVIPLQA